MALFQINAGGKRYQISAPDQATAMAKFQQFQTSGPPQAPSPGAYGNNPMAVRPSNAGAPPPPVYTPSAIPALDPVSAFSDNFVRSLPVVGPALGNFTDNMDAATSSALGMPATPQQEAQYKAGNASKFPAAATAGDIAGPTAAMALAGGIAPKVFGLGDGAVIPKMAAGFGSTTGVMAADNMAHGQSPVPAIENAIVPGAVAAVVPAVAGGLLKRGAQAAADTVNDVRQSMATNTAIKGAPSAADLKAAGSDLFNAVDKSGVTVNTPAFANFVQNATQQATKNGVDQQITPGAWQAHIRLINALQYAQNSGPLTLSNLHTLRQVAQSAAMAGTPADANLANSVVNGIDKFVSNPGNLSSPNGGAPLLKAISTWAQGARTQTVQSAIDQGSLMASGPENGIRLKFLQLARNNQFMGQLSAPQKQAIMDAANGNFTTNAARLFGVMGVSPTSRAIPAALGAAGIAGGIPGVAASAAAVGLGTIAKRVAENARVGLAERAMQAVATPNIPTPAQVSVGAMMPAIDYAGLLGRGALMSSPAALPQRQQGQ